MAACSSIHAWRIPGTEKPGRLQSMGSQRVRHNWAADTGRVTAKLSRKYRESVPVIPCPQHTAHCSAEFEGMTAFWDGSCTFWSQKWSGLSYYQKWVEWWGSFFAQDEWYLYSIQSFFVINTSTRWDGFIWSFLFWPSAESKTSCQGNVLLLFSR